MKMTKMQIECCQYFENGNVFDVRNKISDKYTLTCWSLLKRGYIYRLNGEGGLTEKGKEALSRVLGNPYAIGIDSQSSDENPSEYDYGFVDGVKYANTGKIPPNRLRYSDLAPGQWFRTSRASDDTEPMMMTNIKDAYHRRTSITLSGEWREYNNLTYVELVKPRLSFE